MALAASAKKKGPDLERGREAYVARAWEDAFVALSHADEHAPLAVDDLDRLAWAGALTGRDDVYLKALERAYQARLDRGEELLAARAALWLGLRLGFLGEPGRAGGWLSRAQRLVEEKDCAEAGLLLLPTIHRHFVSGQYAEMEAAARRAVGIADRFHEVDLSAFARDLAGKAAVHQGRVDEGLALLDEAMLSAAGDELSPLITGLLYCNVIASCHRVYAFERAREWTRALAAWCDAQSQLVTFVGSCAIHRVELLQLGGAWSEAIEAASATAQRLATTAGKDAAEALGDAYYQRAEIHRLRGENAPADEGYRAAGEHGRDPQPGLALLRLAQGKGDAAASAIRRVVAATAEPLRRARYLPAAVEVLIAVGDLAGARQAVADLDDTAARYKTDILAAMAAHARAALAVAEGEPSSAIDPLRRALGVWQEAGAPYIVARVRMLLARACRAVGDEDAAAVELGLARKTFTELGAAPDLATPDARPPDSSATKRPDGLSPRELEVLRLVATGKTNKAIAGELHLSEKTIDRHVSNIFMKVNVASRSAATAYAYQRGLV